MENGNGNGNGWVLKTVIGMLWGVIILVLTMTANAVIDNEIKNQDSHTAIRQAIVDGDNIVKDRISKDIQDINNSQVNLLIQQAKILTLLEKKLR